MVLSAAILSIYSQNVVVTRLMGRWLVLLLVMFSLRLFLGCESSLPSPLSCVALRFGRRVEAGLCAATCF